MGTPKAKRIDQFCAGFARGDAISAEAMILQDYLRGRGFESNIYSQHFPERDSDRVRHFREYRENKNNILIYHHSFWSEFLLQLPRLKARKALIFHNMTPPDFVAPYNRLIAEQLTVTGRLLGELAGEFELNLADSDYNAAELREMGYADVSVMPVAFQMDHAPVDLLPRHLEYLDDGCINILFVGRVFPNKRHQDLLKAFYFFRKIHSRSRLLIVGSFHPGVRGYTAELFNLTRELDLKDHVVFTGMVSPSEIMTFYRKSHLFLSMSEHEGFFVPLVECMHLDVPVLAFGSSVIPETLGDSGVIFFQKDYSRVAELMSLIVHDGNVRQRVLEAQRRRRAFFAPERTLMAFEDALSRIGVAPSLNAPHSA